METSGMYLDPTANEIVCHGCGARYVRDDFRRDGVPKLREKNRRLVGNVQRTLRHRCENLETWR